jgi:hypothetical protein
MKMIVFCKKRSPFLKFLLLEKDKIWKINYIIYFINRKIDVLLSKIYDQFLTKISMFGNIFL